MQETWEAWVQSLGGEDALEEEMTTPSSILAWKNPMVRGAWWATVHGVTKSWAPLSNDGERKIQSDSWVSGLGD